MKKIILVLLMFMSLACGLLEKPAIPTVTPTPIPSGTPTFEAKSTPSTNPTRCEVKTGIEDGGLLNLREGAGTNYASVRVLREGEIILLANIPARDGWRSVTVDDLTGWVNASYITCKGK
ncbi:MAG: SH3 domain-containing protein [Anaerolineales bacterium]